MSAKPLLYGILDCAAEPGLYAHAMRLAPLAANCLFEGPLAPELREASPYLVALTPSDPLAQLWRGEGWGRHWGILLHSPESLAQVRRRLRHFTQARLPDGNGPVLFRFWDPRVFRIYMPLVEPDQLRHWFDGIEAYIAETEDGLGSLRYALSGGALTIEERAMPAR